MSHPPPKKLRSAEWFGSADKNGFMYRSWMKNQGMPTDMSTADLLNYWRKDDARLLHIFELTKPVIGAVRGWAMGGGRLSMRSVRGDKIIRIGAANRLACVAR